MGGGRQTIAYEGQAAIEFMEAAGRAIAEPYHWDILENGDIFYLGVCHLIRQVAGDVAGGGALSAISQRFHSTLAEMLGQAAERVRADSGLNTVVLSGGVFNNYLLLERLMAILAAKGFLVLTHTQLPAGDGCLSLGQAMIGRQYLLSSSKNGV
jgi:hydrogenase maturation protein HypF